MKSAERRILRHAAWASLVLSLASACASSREPDARDGGMDSGVLDRDDGGFDAGEVDAGPPDGGVDGGSDAGVDGGPPDGGPLLELPVLLSGLVRNDLPCEQPDRMPCSGSFE